MNQEQFTELVLQSQEGDPAAMEKLLLLSHTPVSYLTQKILQNRKNAQQVTYAVLQSVFSNLSSLQEPDKFEQWLCRITAARCIQASPLLHRNFAESDASPAWDDDLDDGVTLNEKESAAAIQNMVDNLPESQRLCLLLLSCGELGISAIAQLTGFSEGSIKQNIKQGQKTIQQHLWELDTRGIQFTGISSLTDILHDAMYLDSESEDARVMVYDILGKKLPVAASIWIVRLLTVVVILLLLAVLGLAAVIVIKMAGSMLP